MAVIEIENELLKVKINTLGAEMISIVKDGKERVWQGDPEYWSGYQPVLFPVCGSLKGRKYRYNGKEYGMKPHGLPEIPNSKLFLSKKARLFFCLKATSKLKKVILSALSFL